MTSNLQQVIEQVRTDGFGEADWLFIAGSPEQLSLKTDADLGTMDIDEDTVEEVVPQDFAERGLRSTIDAATLKQCVRWADTLAGAEDNHAALDVIRYYLRFDAWPNVLRAPDPPPAEEAQLHAARKFADSLGAEDMSKPCRREGCNRGSVRLSVHCRRHHFESVQNRPYPFED